LFDVDVIGWDEIQARLAQFPDVARKHYPQFFSSAYSPVAVGGGNSLVFGESISEWFLGTGAEYYARPTAHLNVQLPSHGSFEVALAIPNVDNYVADRYFLELFTQRAPMRWNGWSLWMNPQTLLVEEVQPYVREESWEARIVLLNDEKWTFNAIDFWRAWPLGRFYQRRGLWEDGLMPAPRLPGFQSPWSSRTSVGIELDPALQLLHVTEALEAGLVLAKKMQKEPTREKLDFSFRWSGLNGRILRSRFSPGIPSFDQKCCLDDVITTQCYVAASTAIADVPAFARSATAKLFRAFSGFALETAFVDKIAADFLATR
jgi:hypothetical protein